MGAPVVSPAGDADVRLEGERHVPLVSERGDTGISSH